MPHKSKHILYFISFGIIMYAALMNLNVVFRFLQNKIGLIFPILLGLNLAFMLSIPMRGFEKLFMCVLSKSGYTSKNSFVPGFNLILTLFSIILVIAIAFTITIPALTDPIKSIVPLVKEKWLDWAARVGGKLFGLPGIMIFIPLAAVLYSLVWEDTNRRLQEREVKDFES